MNKKIYFTIGALATIIAIVLDRMTGESFSYGPIAVIYMGFFITLQVSRTTTLSLTSSSSICGNVCFQEAR